MLLLGDQDALAVDPAADFPDQIPVLITLAPGFDDHPQTGFLGKLGDLFELGRVEGFEVQVSDGHGLAISWQVQEHVLVAEAFAALVLDKRIAIGVQFHFSAQDEVHAVSIIATPVEHITLLELDISEAVQQLPHEVVILHRLKEVDSVNQLTIGDEKDLVAEHWRQGLDQLLIFVLGEQGHDVSLNELLDLLAGLKWELGFA